VEVLWRRELAYEHVHGPGGSPALVGDLLIVHCDGAEGPFVAALEASTGKERWRTPREPVPVEGALLLRTDTQLLRIGVE
jgi:hypothetical protein